MPRIVTDRGDTGHRIDVVICRHLAGDPSVSRTRVQAWIAQGRVSIRGVSIARPSQKVPAGACLVVAIGSRAPRRTMEPERAPLRVLYEDETLIAIDKPAGVIVHPTFGHQSGTLMNALLWHARAWPTGSQPALVGRLDKGTSGIVLASKNRAAHAALQRATAAGAGTKEYVALVYGRVPARGEIDLPLAADPSDRRRTKAVAGGSPSVTRFDRIAAIRTPRTALALLRCTLGSGRRHQIRVHLAARGWPIVGDPVYGEAGWKEIEDGTLAAALAAFPRQALHAHRLAFRHPATHARLAIESPIPDDFAGLLEAAGLGV